MTRMTPFDDMNRVFDRMSRQFDETWGGIDQMRRLDGPAVDVAEYDDEIVVVVDLPGLSKEDIDLSVRGDTLSISAERSIEQDEESEEGAWVRRERRAESVRRRIGLPDEVHEDEASATYTNGVLTVTLPKVHVDDDGDDDHRIDVN
ncbi:Hsp20/alpha crystallin family protein [Halorarum halophilum]|uniref:Hsp20/alpha crystallin family protein n=1 Tax=Halorarum halophilum TaxID=2743090 RepID=A0A7D5KFM5_9EURY|nr:archaeal heat shock protein Hsp14 [Halobaculum halophilum]QLG29097.1 Hsp20/alpha crystallin family protein [Halobaculum halophilum]